MSKQVSHTKTSLIEVARILFAKHGQSNVTMNDIAEASHKGRRTLYTYFKNKNDVYRAVIDSEMNLVLSQLRLVSDLNLPSDAKLTKHIITHLDAIKELVSRNGSLRGEFFHDIYEVERTRKKIDKEETLLIRSILTEGVEKGIFKRMDLNLSSIIIFYAVKGLEVPYIRQNISVEFEQHKTSIVEFVLRGILHK
jgi:AcrR family transcriptional regulator